MSDTQYILYEHVEGGTTFRGLKSDTPPAWAINVRDEVATPSQATAAPTEKPFNAPGAWFPVDVLGHPMRQHAPGKWENAKWPSDTAATTDLSAAIMALMPELDDSPQFVCGYLQARNEAAELVASQPSAVPQAAGIEVTGAMVDACYNQPEKVPEPAKRMMAETLRRALGAARNEGNDVICDRRDLFDFLRAAWREGQHCGGEMDERERWDRATTHATQAIKGWSTLRHVPQDAPAAVPQAASDAERIAHLEDEEEISEAVIDMMSRLLASIAITLKGEEAALKRHSYHDLAELVKVMALELDLYKTIYGDKVPKGWENGAAVPQAASVDIGLLKLTVEQLKARLAKADEHIERLQAAAPTDLGAALDLAYPMPDSPHASVMNDARIRRTAFIQGWHTGLASQPSAVPPLGSLPPLPVADYANSVMGCDYYTARQMREYARAAIATTKCDDGAMCGAGGYCITCPNSEWAKPSAVPQAASLSREHIEAIQKLGRDDPSVHAFLQLQRRDSLAWVDVLAQMALHLAGEKAALHRMVVKQMSLTPPAPIEMARGLSAAVPQAVAVPEEPEYLPRKIVGYNECRCILTKYCDGKCNPIWADAIPTTPSGEA